MTAYFNILPCQNYLKFLLLNFELVNIGHSQSIKGKSFFLKKAEPGRQNKYKYPYLKLLVTLNINGLNILSKRQ